MKENSFQSQIIKELQYRMPDAIILKNDPNYKQGIPDLTILNNSKWAVLEVKRSDSAPHRPNQDYYIDKMNQMSYAAFIYPGNKEEILDAVVSHLTVRRYADNRLLL